MDNEATKNDDATQVAAPTSPRKMSAMTVLERTTGIILNNRYLWLIIAFGMYALLHLSYLQWQSARVLPAPQFDTLELMALLLAVVEATLLLAALMLAQSLPTVRQAWYRRYPQLRFSYIAHGIGGTLAIVLLMALLLTPLMYLHRYPELTQEAAISVPLMMMQRAMLVTCALLVSYNLMLLLHHVLRFPLWLAGIAGVAGHIALGYCVTYFSFTNQSLERVNDVFYYNQLWHHFDWVPKLSARQVFHNIEMPYFGYYLGLAVILVAFLTFLWLPRASTRTAKEQLEETM